MLVASNLSTTNDLAHLCITSSRLFHIVRPFLYRSIVIKATGYESDASHVLALLARDKSLAKYVVQLTLERCRPPNETLLMYDIPQIRPSLVNVDALTNMVSLKHVTLYGPVFRNAHEQNEFGRVLAPGSGISLVELTYIAGDDNEDFPADRFGDMGGLKRLYWKGGSLKCAFIAPTSLSHCCIHSDRRGHRATLARSVTFHVNDPYALSAFRLGFR
jgi:hypothetical protein